LRPHRLVLSYNNLCGEVFVAHGEGDAVIGRSC
jgi:hypothetical protein